MLMLMLFFIAHLLAPDCETQSITLPIQGAEGMPNSIETNPKGPYRFPSPCNLLSTNPQYLAMC
jgi:hypothetical protein